MPTVVTPQTLLSTYPSLPLAPNSADITFAAMDVTGNTVPLSGREIVLIRNDGVGAHTITVESAFDPYNRTGDITAYSLGAGEYMALAFLAVLGWKQTDGSLHLTASSANLKIAVLRLP